MEISLYKSDILNTYYYMKFHSMSPFILDIFSFYHYILSTLSHCQNKLFQNTLEKTEIRQRKVIT